MARFIQKEQSEMDYVNTPDARSDARRDGGGTAAVSGRKVFKLVAVSFGLLCILQAALNISLRLALYREARCTNWSEDTDGPKRLIPFDHYFQQGWVYYYHRFYYISSNRMSWQESRDDCLRRGADLMIINSKEEQEFANRFQRRTWIGLTDAETEGTWKWVDGTALSTRYWDDREPNGGQRENCAEIRFFDKVYSWSDTECTDKIFWICEKVVAS